jgi:predicted O-methyltransferase YrrM
LGAGITLHIQIIPVYTKIQSAFNYLNYYRRASSGAGHGIHSPFVFEFIDQVLTDKHAYPEYVPIEELRERLLKNNEQLTIRDHGAGSAIDKKDIRTVASIVKNAVKPAKFGQLFFRMVRKYGSTRILELGSSVGITTAYLASANPGGNVLSVEGSPNLAELAERHLQQLALLNAKVVVGSFDEVLPGILREIDGLDLVFIDGNHQQEATLRYFGMVLPKIHENSVLIIDDIHWSRGMENAWSILCKHPSVRCSLDLFFSGILFFNSTFHEPQHFTIRF